MLKIRQISIWWKVIFHSAASSFYLLLLATTYSSGGNVMLVERMVTTWYLIVHIVFIFMALGLDLIQIVMGKSSKISQYFTAFNNIVFISVVFPFGMFVPLTYWCLFFYNCNLILPNIVEITVPNWVSTSSHSVISLVALLEAITTKYTYQGNYITALTTMSAFSVSYVICLVHTYVQFGFWIYPVLHLVPDEELWMVFLALSSTLLALFFSGAGLSYLIHGNHSKSHISEDSKHPIKLKKPISFSSTAKPVPEKIPDLSFDVEKPPPSSLKLKSSPRKKTSQQPLRDFTSTNGQKINNDSENDPEIWHDAVYCPAIASFVENSSRNVRKSKPLIRKRIGIGQNEGIAKWHKNHNNATNISTPSAQDNQQMVQTRSVLSPQRISNPSLQRTLSLADQTKSKLDGIFRSADQDMSMANFPAPIVDDDIPMDSLETTLIHTPPLSPIQSFPEPPPSLENKRKTKKAFSTRKEKSKSITVLFDKNTGEESRSMTNISSLGSIVQQDFSKMKQEKKSVSDQIKSDISVVPGKKDKKKRKEDKGIKRVSKDISKKSFSADTSTSDRWSYFEITSRRGIGKLDTECLDDFETKSLPVDVDDRAGGKKRDYRRNVDGGEISSSIVLRSNY